MSPPEHFSLKHLERYRHAVQNMHDALSEHDGINTRREHNALHLILTIPPAFLPTGTWQEAERLQNQIGRKTTEGEKLAEYEESRKGLFRKILQEMDERKIHWLNYLRTGKLHSNVAETPFKELAIMGRKRLARLKARYDLSDFWRKSDVPDPEGKKILRKLLLAGHITKEERKDFLTARNQGIDPNTYLTRLADKAGVRPEELRIAIDWPEKKIEEITGINLKQEFRKKNKLYHQ